MLPNLIVIGAARCGTTSLYRYLNLHPEIEMSPRKELEFFNEWNWGQDRRNWDRGLRWYESQFPAEAPVVGESTPTYTDYPVQPHVPERMARVVPEAKLIYLVRDPVERFVSSYRFHRWVLKSEHRPIEEVAHDPATSIHLAASCYAMQLEQYLPHYPLERMLVLEQHALAERRAETLRRVFRARRLAGGAGRGAASRHGPTPRLYRRVVRRLDNLSASTTRPGAKSQRRSCSGPPARLSALPPASLGIIRCSLRGRLDGVRRKWCRKPERLGSRVEIAQPPATPGLERNARSDRQAPR